MAKRSMRGVPAQAQDALRDRVIESLNAGMRQAEAARAFGVADRSIRRWVARMRAEGLARVVPRVRGRRAGQGAKLGPAQAECVRRTLMDRLPDELGMLQPLWTRAAMTGLVEREYGLTLAATTASNYLKAWGIRPPAPPARPHARHDALLTQWLQERYPHIAAQAERSKATILWADDRELRGGVTRRGDAGWQHAPLGGRSGHRLLSVVTNRGTLAFQVVAGEVDAQAWITFLERLLRHVRGRRVVLIVPAHPVHGVPALRSWVQANAGRITLHVLPGSAPVPAPVPAAEALGRPSGSGLGAAAMRRSEPVESMAT